MLEIPERLRSCLCILEVHCHGTGCQQPWQWVCSAFIRSRQTNLLAVVCWRSLASISRTASWCFLQKLTPHLLKIKAHNCPGLCFGCTFRNKFATRDTCSISTTLVTFENEWSVTRMGRLTVSLSPVQTASYTAFVPPQWSLILPADVPGARRTDSPSLTPLKAGTPSVFSLSVVSEGVFSRRACLVCFFTLPRHFSGGK